MKALHFVLFIILITLSSTSAGPMDKILDRKSRKKQKSKSNTKEKSDLKKLEENLKKNSKSHLKNTMKSLDEMNTNIDKKNKVQSFQQMIEEADIRHFLKFDIEAKGEETFWIHMEKPGKVVKGVFMVTSTDAKEKMPVLGLII